MLFTEILRKLVFPPRCACCGERLDILENESKEAMCKKCRGEWESAKLLICSKCGMESVDCTCSGKIFDSVRILSIFKFGYGGSADRFIYALKQRNNKRFFKFAIKELYKRLLHEEELMLKDFSDSYFVNAPRSRSSIIKYGFDHAEILARGVAELVGGKYICAIGRRSGGRAQKGLNAKERKKNISNSFFYDEDSDLGGRSVVVIDDVVTTGATVAEVIKILNENNAGEITVLCLAKTGNVRKSRNKKN